MTCQQNEAINPEHIRRVEWQCHHISTCKKFLIYISLSPSGDKCYTLKNECSLQKRITSHVLVCYGLSVSFFIYSVYSDTFTKKGSSDKISDPWMCHTWIIFNRYEQMNSNEFQYIYAPFATYFSSSLSLMAFNEATFCNASVYLFMNSRLLLLYPVVQCFSSFSSRILINSAVSEYIFIFI